MRVRHAHLIPLGPPARSITDSLADESRPLLRIVLDSQLRHAFANDEFELHYQPQVRLSDGALTGAEALLRWRHPERGLLGPHAFIDTLAQSPLVLDVGSGFSRRPVRKRPSGGARDFRSRAWPSTCFRSSYTTIR